MYYGRRVTLGLPKRPPQVDARPFRTHVLDVLDAEGLSWGSWSYAYALVDGIAELAVNNYFLGSPKRISKKKIVSRTWYVTTTRVLIQLVQGSVIDGNVEAGNFGCPSLPNTGLARIHQQPPCDYYGDRTRDDRQLSWRPPWTDWAHIHTERLRDFEGWAQTNVVPSNRPLIHPKIVSRQDPNVSLRPP